MTLKHGGQLESDYEVANCCNLCSYSDCGDCTLLRVWVDWTTSAKSHQLMATATSSYGCSYMTHEPPGMFLANTCYYDKNHPAERARTAMPEHAMWEVVTLDNGAHNDSKELNE